MPDVYKRRAAQRRDTTHVTAKAVAALFNKRAHTLYMYGTYDSSYTDLPNSNNGEMSNDQTCQKAGQSTGAQMYEQPSRVNSLPPYIQ